LFHNLRASRETELAERFPIHVVVAWLGNTPEIARRHYLQVTDHHFEQALTPEPGPRRAAPGAAATGRNPSQNNSDNGGKDVWQRIVEEPPTEPNVIPCQTL